MAVRVAGMGMARLYSVRFVDCTMREPEAAEATVTAA